jgi:hypothetical protein
MEKEGNLETHDLIGIEVKKLERDKHGRIARSAGLDYNSTPPSKTITAYHDGSRIQLPGFYLFVCLEQESRGKCKITAMALCDGGVLNEDIDLYSATTGQRKKQIGLGSYGDGLDRQRPMLVFPNPLGWSELDGTATLIHRSEELSDSRLVRVGKVQRARPPARRKSVYSVYRDARDAKPGGEFDAVNPFPSVARRSSKTQPRGRFHIQFS